MSDIEIKSLETINETLRSFRALRIEILSKKRTTKESERMLQNINRQFAQLIEEQALLDEEHQRIARDAFYETQSDFQFIANILLIEVVGKVNMHSALRFGDDNVQNIYNAYDKNAATKVNSDAHENPNQAMNSDMHKNTEPMHIDEATKIMNNKHQRHRQPQCQSRSKQVNNGKKIQSVQMIIAINKWQANGHHSNGKKMSQPQCMTSWI